MTPIRESDTEGLLTNKDLKPRNPNMLDFETALNKIKPSVAPNELENYAQWQTEFGSQ